MLKTLLAVIISLAFQQAAFAEEANPGIPATHNNFNDRDEDFSFAVISDLNGGERAGVFDVAVAGLNLLRPAFVMSIGDLIQGYTEDAAELERQWDSFDRRAAKLKAPFFYVVGNHDIFGAASRQIWEKRLKRRYYHFVYKDVLFLALDSEDFSDQEFADNTQAWRRAVEQAKQGNAAPLDEMNAKSHGDGTLLGAVSPAQIAYFKQAIAQNPDVRWTFLFMHKSLWQGDGNPGLREIETALNGRPFTVFSGHHHSYKSFGTGDSPRHMRLGTTGGSWVDHNPETEFDHIVMVNMTPQGPAIANLKLNGILDAAGRIPAGGESLCLAYKDCPQKK